MNAFEILGIEPTQDKKTIKETGALSAEVDEPEGTDSKERKLQKALTALDQMERYHKLGYEDWKELFSREEYQQAMSQSSFLYRWSEILEKLTIDKKLYQLMVGKLKSIARHQDDNEQTAETVGLIEPIELTEMKIRAAYNRYRGNQKKRYKIITIAILILTSVIKIHERKEDREWKKHMQDSINYEHNLSQGNVEWLNDNKKGLNTVSDFDLLEAELSLDKLAKFLMRADEEIVSIVLPYTQTLKPGMLVLSEEFKFKVKKVLQAGNAEKAGGVGNEYELVPLSLPLTNRILVGGESVDLPKGTIEFAVRTENLYDSVLLWIDPKEMGFEKGCEIYCFDGEDYQKAGRRVSGDGEQAEIYFYDVLTYQVLCIRVSRLGEEEYPVVLIPVE